MNINILICILLIIHHRIKHRNNKKLNKFQKWFQKEDIDNHETFILFFLGIFIGQKYLKKI